MKEQNDEAFISGLQRALDIMRAHDRYPDDYLTGISQIEEEIKYLLSKRWMK
jgi:hypothetical protein